MLEKLLICGIRSYSPKSTSIIEFSYPLTLILGKNGSGKTTIIECLKYGLTGDLPPNSKGGAFIYDPKVAREVDTKAQVKIKFKNVKGESMICTRSLQLTQKKLRMEQKTIENLLAIKRGEKFEAVSGKIQDIDKEVERSIGISKSLLENIIFCHQEEACWILSEPGIVKKKLDEIFSSTKYTKALEVLNSLKKCKKEELKSCRIIKEQKKKDLNRCKTLEDDIEKSKDKIDSYTKSVQTLNKSICKKEKIIKELKAEIDDLDLKERLRIEATREIEKLKKNIFSEKIDEFSRAEISEKIKDRTEILDEYENEMDKILAVFHLEANVCDKELSILDENLKDAESKKFPLEKQLEYFKKNEEYENERKKKQNLKEELLSNIKNFVGELIENFQKILELNENKATNFSEEVPEYSKEDLEDLKESLCNRQEMDKENIDQLLNLKVPTMIIRNCNEIKREKEREYRRAQDLIYNTEQKIKTLEEHARTLIKMLGYEEFSEESIIKIKKRLKEIEIIDFKRENESFYKQRIESLMAEMEEQYGDIHQNTLLGSLNKKKEELAEKIGGLKIDDLENKKIEIIKNLRDQPKMSEEVFEAKILKIKEITDKLSIYNEKTINSSLKVELDNDNTINSMSGVNLDTSFMKEKKRFDFSFVKEEQIKEVKELNKDLEQNKRGLICVENAHNIYTSLLEYWNKEKGCPLCKSKDVDPKGSNISVILEKIQKKIQKCKENVKTLSCQAKMIEEINELKKEKNLLVREVEPVLKSKKKKTYTNEDLRIIYEKIGCYKELQKTLDEIKLMTKENKENRQNKNTIEDLKQEIKELREMEELVKEESGIKAILSDLENIKIHKKTIENIELERILSELKVIDEETSEYTSSIMLKSKEIQKNKEKIKENILRHKIVLDRIKEIDNKSKKVIDVTVDDIQDKYNEIIKTILKLSEERNNLKDKRKKLTDNIRLLGYRKNLEEQKIKYKNLRDEIIKKIKEVKTKFCSRIDPNTSQSLKIEDIKKIYLELQKSVKDLSEKVNVIYGELKQIHIYTKKLKSTRESFGNIEEEHLNSCFEHMLLENNIKDIEKGISSIENGLIKYHKEKIDEINRRLVELWTETYKGNDIDYIELRSEMNNRSYSYRMIMVKNLTELDMRGRCSAGQKVIASILFRLAIADSFIKNNNILSLDEPTTNLDQENVESLAKTLSTIIKKRGSENIQLLVITHDEDFVRRLNSNCEFFYKLSRDKNGDSLIERCPS